MINNFVERKINHWGILSEYRYDSVSAHACATFFVRCYIRFQICWYYAKWPIRIKTGIIMAILRAKESNTIGQAYNCNKFVPSDFVFNSLNFRFQPIVLATL